MDKEIGIYQVRQISSNQILYIGSSVNVALRIRHHRNALERNRHPNRKLQKLFRRFGRDDFEFLLVEECSEQLLAVKENEWIDVMRPVCNSVGRARRKKSSNGGDSGFICKPEKWSHWFWKD